MLFIATEGYQDLEPLPDDIVRILELTDPVMRVPNGVRHAVETGQDTSLCGKPREFLFAWPHLPWPGGLLGDGDTICPTCASASQA